MKPAGWIPNKFTPSYHNEAVIVSSGECMQ